MQHGAARKRVGMNTAKQDTIEKIFSRDDYDLPNERWELKSRLELEQKRAAKLLGQIRRSAERLSNPTPDHMTLRAIDALASMGDDYRDTLGTIRQIELKLRVIEEIEHLYSDVDSSLKQNTQ